MTEWKRSEHQLKARRRRNSEEEEKTMRRKKQAERYSEEDRVEEKGMKGRVEVVEASYSQASPKTGARSPLPAVCTALDPPAASRRSQCDYI